MAANQPARYAIVGLGARAAMYLRAITSDYAGNCRLVAMCDPNGTRMRYYQETFPSLGAVTTHPPDEFDTMLREQQVDTVIVTSVDRTHDRYIVAALRNGCRVITEKPLTTDPDRCQRILDEQARSGSELTVTFNYRYAPRNSTVKELLRDGAIGNVQSVHFEWLLDTQHGADYFRRWHRDKRNSGGLMVHKASHHFDLVNWWLGARPVSVFGFGDLRFYGRENAERRGEHVAHYRSHGSGSEASDRWQLDLAGNPGYRRLYLDAEHEDGYLRDRNVFDDGVSIEDDMAALVRYDTGATLSYHLTAYAPWEGYRVAFNGDRGRLQLDVIESPYVPVSGAKEAGSTQLTVQPLWERSRVVEVPEEAGGHGGGDRRLLADLFAAQRPPDPLGRAATHVDGAYAMLVGAAANRSFATGRPVHIGELVRFPGN